MKLTGGSLLVNYADELIAEHRRNLAERGLALDMQSTEGKLASCLSAIVEAIRKDDSRGNGD